MGRLPLAIASPGLDGHSLSQTQPCRGKKAVPQGKTRGTRHSRFVQTPIVSLNPTLNGALGDPDSLSNDRRSELTNKQLDPIKEEPMEKIDAKLQELKGTFSKIDRATAVVRRQLYARGATSTQIQESRANLRGDAIDEFLDHLNAWIIAEEGSDRRRARRHS
jgi:hypothetical protein